MPDIVFLLLGIYLLVMAVLFFMGKPRLVREKFRSRLDLKPYMQKCGGIYAILGIAGVVFYFFQDAIFAHKVVALIFGLVIFAALVTLIIFNHLFMNKG